MLDKNIVGKVKGEVKNLKLEILEKLSVLIASALGFVAAFGWNEAIKGVFDKYLSASNSVLGKFIYAIAVTIIAVVAIIYVGRAINKLKQI